MALFLNEDATMLDGRLPIVDQFTNRNSAIYQSRPGQLYFAFDNGCWVRYNDEISSWDTINWLGADIHPAERDH